MATASQTRVPPSTPPVAAENNPSQPSGTTPVLQHGPLSLPIPNHPPSQTLNSVPLLRGLSTALSAFCRRYDELQEHLDFIRTFIDSKLPADLAASLPALPEATTAILLAADELEKGNRATNDKPSSEMGIHSFCKSMCSRSVRKYIMTHLSDTAKLRKEVPEALKLAEDPPKLVLECFGRFFLQGIKAYTKDSPMIPAREASILILELFLLMGCDNNQIETKLKEEAESAAVAWRNRLIVEGGLSKACEIEARGLLLLIGCFGIPSVFKNEDIADLVRAGRARGISDALRRSDVLLARIPEIIDWMVSNDMEVRAVNIVYDFGLESRFPPQTILSSFIRESKANWKKAKKAALGSVPAVTGANRKHLRNLKLAIKCSEDHNIDLSKAFSGWKISDAVSSLEKEIADLKKKSQEEKAAKRKADQVEASEKFRSQEPKRPRFAGNWAPQQQRDSAFGNENGISERISPIHGGYPPSHISGFPAASSSSLLLHGAGVPSIVGAGILAGTDGSILARGPYSGVHGRIDRAGQVIGDNGLPYGWRGGDYASRERLIERELAESAALRARGLLGSLPGQAREGFAGLPRSSIGGGGGGSSRNTNSDLYQFADSVVESEAFGGARRGASYLY